MGRILEIHRNRRRRTCARHRCGGCAPAHREQFGGGRLTATFRLTYPRGSIIGTTSMPYTISGNEISFAGTSRFTGGTGIYRGIASGPLDTHDHNTLDGQNGRLSVAGSAKY